jgi:DASS family divalent anion:Na+ symporter
MIKKHFIGWLFLILASIGVFFYMSHLEVDKDTLYFSVIVTITLSLWIFNLVSDFIPALLAMLMILLLGLAPSERVLSGFSSQAFLLAFSVLGLGAVILQSGLTRRYTLWILYKLPANTIAHQFAVFMTGSLFTPVIPTITGRAVIVAPVMNHIVKGWDTQTRKTSSTAIYTSGLDSIAYLSPVFLTAAPANLMVFGLFSSQDQYVYDYLFWLYAASITGLSMLLLYFVVSTLYFRNFNPVQINKDYIQQERQKLGPYNWREVTAIFAIVLLGIALATLSVHKIPIAYVTFFILVSLLMLGALSRHEFIEKIDWAFLFMLAGIIGILATMKHLGIDDTVIQQLSWLGEYMRNDFSLFVLYLSIAILLVRLIIPLNSAILIFAAALIPIAEAAGVSTWLVGFIILIMAETAFFGYQSPYILAFRRMVKEGQISYEEYRVQIFHLLLIPVKLAAIYISIPFWKNIGVL